MERKSAIKELYEEINSLYESLDIIDLFLIASCLVKDTTIETNKIRKDNVQNLISQYGEFLASFVSELLVQKQDEVLMRGIRQSDQAERSIYQLEITKILFEEKLKRVKMVLDDYLEGKKEVA